MTRMSKSSATATEANFFNAQWQACSTDFCFILT